MKVTRGKRDWWGVAVALAVLGLLALCVSRPILWDWLGVKHENPYFLDLAAILAASDAHAAGVDPYVIPSPFDPWGRPHVYGPWWLYLHQLGLGLDDLFWLGGLLAVTAIVAMIWVIRPRGWFQAATAALLLGSPAMLLAFERGNNDLVIVLMLIAAGAVSARGGGIVWRAAWMWAAAVLKFYPAVAMVLLFRGERPRRVLAAGVAILGASLVTCWLWRDDFSRALSVLPSPHTTYGYGVRLIPAILFGRTAFGYVLAYGGAVALAGALVWRAGAFRAHAVAAMTKDSSAGAWFIAAGSCWSLCYFANANYPYRAALLILAAASWFEMARDGSPEARSVGRRLILLLTIALWMPFLQLILVVVTSASVNPVGFLLLGLEHGLVLGLTAGVIWAISCMTLRSVRGWRCRA